MSQKSVRKNYIEADVFSATPQKLQLLLVEAAIKNVLKTKKYWEEGNIGDGFDTITRAQDIVAEILCSLDVEKSPDIAKKLASIYVFIFRRLTEAGMRQDLEKLNDAYRVLCSERETWKLVCEKFGSTKSEAVVSSVGQSAQMPAADATKSAPGATAWVSSAPMASDSKFGSENSATFTSSTSIPADSAVQAKPNEGSLPKSQIYSRPITGTSKTAPVASPTTAPSTAAFTPAKQFETSGKSKDTAGKAELEKTPVPPVPRQPSASVLGNVSSFQPHIPAMPTLGSALSPLASATPVAPAKPVKSAAPSLRTLGTGTHFMPPSSPTSTSENAAMEFKKSTSPTNSLEFGSSPQRIELVNPMGSNEQLSTATPMSVPPQNANIASEASSSHAIHPTAKPLPHTGTGNIKTDLSWKTD